MKKLISRWLVIGTIASWLIALGLSASIIYIEVYDFDTVIVYGCIFFVFFPIVCWLVAAIVVAVDDHHVHDKHIERIVCPECLRNCEAEVIHTDLWCVYVHECEHCGHIITESEWNEKNKK